MKEAALTKTVGPKAMRLSRDTMVGVYPATLKAFKSSMSVPFSASSLPIKELVQRRSTG
jgi:hypothetical protein